MRNGEVWLVNFSPSVGDEITKTRPAVVVNGNDIRGLAICIVVPITGATKFGRPWHVKITPSPLNNLDKESFADCLQIKSFSTERFNKRLGALSETDLDDIKSAIASVLDLI